MKKEQITKEFCIEEINRLHKKFGKVTDEILREHGAVSGDTLKRRFGSITNAYIEAGVELKQGQRKMVSKPEIVKELNRLNKEFGYVSKPIMEKYSSYSPKIVQRIFGSFSNMYEELNFKRAPNGIILSDDELINKAKEVYEKTGFLSYDLISKFCDISATAFKDRVRKNGWDGINYYREQVGCEIPTLYWCESPSSKYAIGIFTKLIGEEPIKEKRFKWLYYKRANNKLRIDAFYENLNLAVEYNGPQHYFIDGHYTKSQKDLERKQEIEKYKIKLLQDHGIKVIVIHFKDKVDEQYVKDALSSVGIK